MTNKLKQFKKAGSAALPLSLNLLPEFMVSNRHLLLIFFLKK